MFPSCHDDNDDGELISHQWQKTNLTAFTVKAVEGKCREAEMMVEGKVR